jgi:hypothetical protein
MFFSKSLKNIDDKEYLGKEEYTILKTPNDPLITYKGLKFSTQADLFIYKNQNYVNDNMRWLEIQTFKLNYDKKYSLECLYIKNANSIDKSQIMIYSQCFYTNFASSLPFLVDLSSFLKINIITYEYNNKDKQEYNYLDINILYNYLHKIEFIKSIILIGLSIGNKINMSIMLSKMNINSKSKLKAFIFISPTWVYDLSHLKQIKNLSSIKGDVGEFIEAVNSLKIPIFIAHGKQDTTVKYFLSVPFLQKINNKFEWLPKNGTHYDIINEHRTKLLIKLKEFFLNNNLLNSEKTHFDAFSKINEDEIASNKGIAERTTAFFTKENSNNDNKNKIDEQNIINLNINDEGDDYYGHYNTNDIMGNKKSNNKKNKNDKNNNGIYTVYKSKIKDSDNITLNQSIKDDDITINQNMKEDVVSLNKDFKTFEEISLNQDVNYNNITIGNNMEYDNITINQSIIQYDEHDITANNIPRISTVSFIPGDIIPTFKNKNANPNQSFIYNKKQNKKTSRNISFMSFNV